MILEVRGWRLEVKKEYIWTCQSGNEKVAQVELKRKDRSFELVNVLDNGVYLSKTDLTISELVDRIQTTPMVFIRHVCKVDMIIGRCIGLEEIVDAVYGLALTSLDKNLSYTVQIRVVNNGTLKKEKMELCDLLNQRLDDDGYVLNVKHCQQIISIFIDKSQYYIGISPAGHNLSIHAGGMRHYAKDSGIVSRAAYKLMEAVEVFDIPMKSSWIALDLGASPGGWSKVLLDKGMQVTAIDPGLMDEAIRKHPNLKHYQETTQKFIERKMHRKYQLIVNDMKINANDSIDLTNEFASFLDDQGYVIMTLKLPQTFDYRFIKTLLARVNHTYQLIHARQLFHNRSEITVVLKKRK